MKKEVYWIKQEEYRKPPRYRLKYVCSNCGTRLREKDKKCYWCGATFEEKA